MENEEEVLEIEVDAEGDEDLREAEQPAVAVDGPEDHPLPAPQGRGLPPEHHPLPALRGKGLLPGFRGHIAGRCYKCGVRGHRARACQSRAVCWLCGQRGHTRVVCPQRQTGRTTQKRGQQKPSMQFTNCTFEKFSA
ncbi:uncharacterized protein LOC114544315 isoform X8 [Dendronephthya gigantea]|uniref:uncharacterized protein LOC114540720 n=1 Tax=Dendronephthya gigantea TaxID=151771 RepID=UPI00106A6A4B|nr:uncharacterized protein LOC114540720 [Dendronephthya gigantea]XP_028418792.1 uncharacterized protein LOC114544315 isoform X8 [Dendronephthya gigantea]